MTRRITNRPILPSGNFSFVPKVGSGLGILVSCLVLLGWTFEIEPLRSIFSRQPQMVPITAITFVLASVSLGMACQEKRSQKASLVPMVCAVAVILIGLLTLAEYLIGSDLGFDRVLFAQK